MRSILVSILVVAYLLAACSPPRMVTPAPAGKETTPLAKPDWEKKWESTVAEAKKEGSVSVYALWRPEVRNNLTRAFKEKYGINVEYSPFSRGAELLAKVQVEKRARLNVADVFGAGGPTLIATMKPEGVLGPAEPLLILPEVIDPRSWSGGRFPFLDKDRLAIGMIANVERYILFNTNLVKEGELTTYKDVLKPQYRGKITLNDPAVTGTGNAFISHLAHDIWNLDEASEFLRQLIRQQEVAIQRDNRLHVESVARGKFATALAPQTMNVNEFFSVGAPIAAVINKEGTFVSPASGAMAVSSNPAHPNAAAVFVNWLLSKEGQTAFSRGFGNPSMRVDVSTEGFLPIFLPQPGERIYTDSEDLIVFRGKMLDVAKAIIQEATK